MRHGAATLVLVAALAVTAPGPVSAAQPTAASGCRGFAARQAAQTFLSAHPDDPRGLDPDLDKVACDDTRGASATATPVPASTRRTTQEPGGADLPWWAWTAASAGVVWLLVRSLRTPRRR